MFDIGDVVAHIKADATGFTKTINDVRDRVSGVSNSFTNLGSSITGFAVKTSLAFGAAGIAATTFAIRSAADVEMLRASFDTLLGSAEKGRELFGKIQKMANVTPFETQDLAEASKTLLAFGINVDDLLPTLKNLGDISLGNREKFKSLALVFGQVSSAGKLQGQDLLQLVNLGFNPLQKISERTGESMASLKEKMSAGEISFKMVQEEFQRSTAEGGIFFGGMEKGSKTLTGLWSTLSDNAKITARSIVGLSETGDIIKGGLFDKITLGVQQLIVWIEANKASIVSLGQAFFTNVFEVGKKVVEIMGQVISFFQQHKVAVDILIGVLGGGLAVALIAVIAYVGSLIVAFIGLVSWVGILVGVIVGAFTVISRNSKDASDYVIAQWNNFIGWLRGIGGQIGTALGNVKSAITKPFIDAFDFLKDKVGGVVDALKKLNPFARHSPSLVDLVTRGTNVIKNRYSSMFDAIGSLADSFQPSLQMAAPAMGNVPNSPVTLDKITINTVAFMGTPGEARKLAEMVVNEKDKIERAKG